MSRVFINSLLSLSVYNTAVIKNYDYNSYISHARDYIRQLIVIERHFKALLIN